MDLNRINPRTYQLTTNFKLWEFFKEGGTFSLTLWNEFLNHPKRHEFFKNLNRLAHRLQQIRDFYMSPITITNGWRSMRYHKAIYKRFKRPAPLGSFHLIAKAADIVVAGKSAWRVQQDFNGWSGGMGMARTFTHFDTRSYMARWRY